MRMLRLPHLTRQLHQVACNPRRNRSLSNNSLAGSEQRYEGTCWQAARPMRLRLKAVVMELIGGCSCRSRSCVSAQSHPSMWKLS